MLVTIDTLRADRLGCYGSRDVATPNLDRLAREGALAAEATVHVPLTRPSHASLLTGLLPAEHGLRDNVTPPLAGSIPTLAETLQKAGFATGGVRVGGRAVRAVRPGPRVPDLRRPRSRWAPTTPGS